MKLTKRNFLWIVPIIVIIIFWYYYGPKEEITDNDFITYIKQAKYSSQSQNYEEAFSNYCEKGKWVYFQTSNNQNVVEFKGTCPNDNSTAKVNLQFIINNEKSNFTIGALLINGEQQSEENRDQFLQSAFKNP